jgi:L-alanine-DL-glutamate epimerase-like enolase superfamily enzyme
MIVSVDVHAQPLVRSFRVSRMTTESVDVVSLRLSTEDGVVWGAGEISADAGYGQDGAAIARQAGELAARLAADPAGSDPAGSDPVHLECRLHDAARTVSAGALMVVEMAFLDRAARLRGLPVWRLLGLPEPGLIRLMTTVPIGEELPNTGRSDVGRSDVGRSDVGPSDVGPLKIKLGGRDDLAVLRGLVGVPGPIILDVNRGWDRADWLAVRPLVAEIAPAVLEDPVGDPALLPEVRRALPGTAVLLDEGIGGQADVEHATAVADGANVKVMKLGGLFAARRALEYLTKCGATRMLGCYLEPPRAIAYAAQFGGMADWTDLDGHFWLSPEHPAVPEFRLDSSRPGIPRMAS